MGDNPQPTTSGKSGIWARIGIFTAAIAALAALSTQLVTIGDAFPKIFPWLAPFDADISIRDPRVEKISPVNKIVGGSVAEPALEIQIEYIEEKKG
jgi:hypothetical protein